MKTLHLMAASAVASAVLIFAAAEVDAQQRAVGGGARNDFSGHSNLFSWERGAHRFRGGFGGVLVVEREVPVYIEVPAPAPPPPNPLTMPLADRPPDGLRPVASSPPRGEEKAERKPYVIGASYASLPGGCMKMIEEGVSFYYCDGGWYREVRGGRDPLYRAVARKL